MTLKLEKLGQPCGAQISGIDLKNIVPESEYTMVRGD